MNKNNAIKQWVQLGLYLGATAKDFEAVTVTPVETINSPPVKTAEEAQRLYGQHHNWATVARLMDMKKAEVIALVHSADTRAEGLTVKEATKIALNGKAYRTMKELVAVVREQNLKRPAYTRTVDVHVHQMIKAGQVKVRKEVGQLTGYKLVG